VIVVVAYGHILPSVLLRMPPWGCVNIHASLLPRYRGPAPIQRAVINREPETGVTIMKMDSGLDTGDILLSRSTPIGPDDTAATLHDRLASIGASLLLETLGDLETVFAAATPQDEALATYAPMLTKAHGRIDWSKSADDIDALIRGTQPWPGAYTFLEGRRLKVFRGQVVPREAGRPPGTVVTSPTEELWVATGNGILSLVEVQAESSRRMSIADFLKGRMVKAGSIVGA
jgi:methionyl-tRNA formyltransferase